MDLQLKHKTALVTGASVGIGRGIAKALATEGVRVAVSARRVDKLRELADEIVAAGGHAPVDDFEVGTAVLERLWYNGVEFVACFIKPPLGQIFNAFGCDFCIGS